MDLSKPSTSKDYFGSILSNETPSSNYSLDGSNLDPLFIVDEQAEQEIVFKFLDDELNFDYRERVAAVAAADEESEAEEEEEEAETIVIKTENEDEKATSPVVRKTRKKRKEKTKLPAALKGLMGEANLRCARGDKETAVKLCLEIIRQVPTAAEPFQTLAGIYEETGEREKGLQMALVAAHLSYTDVSRWEALADQSEELGNTRQAITCLTKAINLDMKNMNLHRRRAELLEKIGDRKTAVRGYMRLLLSLDATTSADYIVSVARFVAELCHKSNDYEKANEALELAVLRVPNYISYDFVNLHLELLILLKNYHRCLEIMVAFCDLVVEAETGSDDHGNETFSVVDVSIPDTTPVDILSKLGVVLIQMGSHMLVDQVLAPVFALDVAEVGELYLDVAEAWVEKGCHEEAIKLYEALVASEAFALPGVWLKLGDSLEAMGRLAEAAEAYRAVLAGVEGHAPVRLALVRLLHRLGREIEALDLLPSVTPDPALLYARANLLASSPNPDPNQLVPAAMALFSRHSISVTSAHQVTAISGFTRTDRRRATVCGMQGARPVPPPASVPDGPSPEEEWALFLKACQAAYSAKQYASLYSLAATAQLSLVLATRSHRIELDLLSSIGAHLTGDHSSAYNYLRNVIFKCMDNPKLWTLFNMMAQRYFDGRLHRFVMRLAGRQPNHSVLSLLHGNNCLVSGTFKYALHEYHTARARPELDLALVSFLTALTYLQIAAQKFTASKHSVSAQAIGIFSDYRKKRNQTGRAGEQEAHYNLGRALQHLGIFNAAAAEYIAAMECEPCPLVAEDPEIFNLKREAAFNLHLIYLNSGNHELAAYYISKIQI